MNGLILLRRFMPGFPRRRRQFLASASRLRELDDPVTGSLMIADLGFGPELWEVFSQDILIEREWFTVQDAKLITAHGDSERAVAEAERLGWSMKHVNVKF